MPQPHVDGIGSTATAIAPGGDDPNPRKDVTEHGGPAQDSALDRRYAAWTRPIAGTSGGRAVLRAVVFVVGLLFAAGGVVLAVLPGPLTIPPILAGVYIWSLEFSFARRLRVRVDRSARKAWDNARQRPVRASTITVLGLVGAAAAVWAASHYDLVDRLKDLVS